MIRTKNGARLPEVYRRHFCKVEKRMRFLPEGGRCKVCGGRTYAIQSKHRRRYARQIGELPELPGVAVRRMRGEP